MTIGDADTVICSEDLLKPRLFIQQRPEDLRIPCPETTPSMR